MIVKLRAVAVQDLATIEAWLEPKSPRAAKQLIDEILDQTDLVGNFPFIGHEGAIDGTREWIAPRRPYIIVYRIDPAADQVQIVGVFHAAQDRGHHDR